MTRRDPIGGSARGFTIIEAVVSLLIVGGTLVAAMGTLSLAIAADRRSADQARARLLAQDLMAEIMQLPYSDPANPGSFGRSADEAFPGNRSRFDDVDDYAGWTETPPRTKPGVAIPGATGYTRRVSVAWTTALAPSTTLGSESALKRVTVEVEAGGRRLASLTAVRASNWPLPPYRAP